MGSIVPHKGLKALDLSGNDLDTHGLKFVGEALVQVFQFLDL